MIDQLSATKQKPRARSDTVEARSQIASILTSLTPTFNRKGLHLDIPLPGSDQPITLPLRGNRMIVRSYVASLYQPGTMPISSFNYALSELIARLRYEYEQAKATPNQVDQKIKVEGHSNLYIVPGEGICTIRINRNGDELLTQLWSTIPIVHARYVVPSAISGYELQYDLQIGCETDRHVVSVDELRKANWSALYPNLSGVLSVSRHGMYIDVISQLATLAPIKFGVEATGWYNVGDATKPEWVYLLHDGRYISSDGMVHAANTGKVELRKTILTDGEVSLWSSYQIPVTSTVEAHKEAVTFLTQLTSKHQALLLLSHAAISMLYDVRTSHYGTSHSLALVGKPGSGKTALSALARCLVYPYKRKPLSDASYEDTVASMEFRLAARRSVPVFVDDLPERDYSSQGKRQEYINKADSLIRATYNESPVKHRMTSKLQHQKANTIQTLPSHTWEVVPDVGTSCLRRVLILTLDECEIPTDSTDTTSIALDQIHKHITAIQNIGYRLAVFTAKMLEKHGKDGLATRLFEKQAEYEKRVRASILSTWSSLRSTETIPSEWSSIAENASYELVGLWLLDQVTLCESNLVDAAFDSLVETVYTNILRVAGTGIDETGYTPIEQAILSVFNAVADTQTHNGSTWVVERYTSKKEQIKPTAIRSDGTQVPYNQWGKATNSDNSHTIAHIDEHVTYLTRTFRDALKAEYNQLPGIKPLTSDKALTQLLDRSGWLVRPDTKQATKDMYPHGIRIHGVLSLPNEKLFKLLDIARLEPLPEITPELEAVIKDASEKLTDLY